MTRPIVVALALSCFIAEAKAADYAISFVSGNTLYQRCQSNPDFCLGFVAGVTEGISFDQHGTAFCTATGVTDLQIRDVVKLWLHDHPEKRHLAGGFLVLQALKEKFPCN